MEFVTMSWNFPATGNTMFLIYKYIFKYCSYLTALHDSIEETAYK